MNHTLLEVVGLLLGTAEQVVPIFIKNPQSQKIEGVFVTAANNLFSEVAQLAAAGTGTQTAATQTATAQPAATAQAAGGIQ